MGQNRNIHAFLKRMSKLPDDGNHAVLIHNGLWVTELDGRVVGELPPAITAGRTQEQMSRWLIERGDGLEGVILYDNRKPPKVIWPELFRGLGP